MSTKKDNKFIIGAIVMVAAGVAVSFAGHAYLASVENAKDAAIKALIGDAEVTTGQGTADGFAGPVNATVSYAGDVIVDLTLTGESETPDIGGAAMNTLKEQILAAHTYEGIDVVSGATYSSNAVLSAVKQAMGIVEVVKTDEEVFEEMAQAMLAGCKDKAGVQLAENVLAAKCDDNGNYLFMVQGVGHYEDYPFKVAVLVKADGTVGDIQLIYSHETDGFGSEVLNENHWAQYLGASQLTRKTGGEGTKIDTVSGATETSVGLYNCVKAALTQFAEF